MRLERCVRFGRVSVLASVADGSRSGDSDPDPEVCSDGIQADGWIFNGLFNAAEVNCCPSMMCLRKLFVDIFSGSVRMPHTTREVGIMVFGNGLLITIADVPVELGNDCGCLGGEEAMGQPEESRGKLFREVGIYK